MVFFRKLSFWLKLCAAIAIRLDTGVAIPSREKVSLLARTQPPFPWFQQM